MHLKSKYKLIVLGALASFAGMVGYDYLSEKSLQVYPADEAEIFSWTDASFGGNSRVEIIDHDPLRWRCDIRESESFYLCGVGVSLLRGEKGVDLSAYSSMVIKLSMDSPEERIRVLFKSGLGEFSGKNGHTEQFSYLVVPWKSVQNEANIDLSAMTVADWWITASEAPPEFALPRLEEVRSFNIEVGVPPRLGIHELTLERVELKGRFVSPDAWLRSALLFWVVLLVPSGILRYLEMHRRLSIEGQQLERLANYSQQLQDERERFKEMSTVDKLTGTLNRNGFEAAFSTLIKELAENDQLALIIIDLDHFKKINDQLGHDAGDEVLRAVAKTLADNLRGSDRLARWGGEEFIVLCPHTHEAGAFTLAEKLRRAVAETTFNLQPSPEVTVSIGVGCFRVSEPFADAFKRIDEVLYQAKRQGRNRSVIAD